MTTKETLSWVQTLKESIINKLKKRNIQFDEREKFDVLRKKLREAVKSELEKSENKPGEKNKIDIETTDQEVQQDQPNEMTKNVKIEFRLHKDDWETFTEQMEQLFIANDTKEEKKAAQILVRVDTEAFKLMKQLLAPDKVATKKYDDIVKVMNKHLNPKPSEVMERCKFNQAKQEESESVADFAAKLKKLALNCNFADIKTALRDQFVCGLKEQSTKVELFKKTDLDFETAYKEAIAREAAEKNAKSSLTALKNTNEQKDDVFVLSNTRNKWKNNYNNEKDITCYCCGKKNHTSKVCRFKEYTCHNCKKKGHLQQACRSKGDGKKKKQERVQLLEHRQEDSSEEDSEDASSPEDKATSKRRSQDFYYFTANVKNVQSEVHRLKTEQNGLYDCMGAPMYENVEINDVNVCMELNTGTYATVISELYYNKYFKSCNIVKTERNLKTYDEKILQPIGKLTNLKVKYRNAVRKLNCFVLPGSGPMLMGRKWLAEFGMWPLQIKNVRNSKINKLNVQNVKNELAEKYTEFFSDSPGKYNKSKSKIYLKENARPIALKCRSVAYALRSLIENELKRLEKLGHLEPVEISEWATPIVPVFKSNGNIRICGDFKTTLNKFILADKYPLHTIDDIFAKLQGGNSFSELDLTHAYMQFPVDGKSSEYLTIVTHKGLFRYTKLPEGVSVAPTDVQRKMDECLQGIDSVIPYLENIYVTGKSDEEHFENLHKVCKRLQECGLRVNKNKCFFMKDKLEVLSFVIDKEGLHKAESKIKAMTNAPRPTNTKELESFLELINFYARFLQNRSDQLKLLYEASRKEKFEWNDKCTKAFNWVKKELTSHKVLVNYDPKQTIILACDASDYGLSAILSHRYSNGEERPIAFASKKIPKHELNRKILDKEAMAIVFGCKRFYQFIFGKEFILRTNNKALQLILGPRKGIPITADNRF
ncbi:uncharacterized protein K02A2.6-like [Monomorium pharaonis]|uniref:uncharacterized protein K02A2.6-like n=1 Tax=Monomorium pharaonis TaxID=307658 RepID=UPI001746B7DE|nr:uncharacterized protein K02A2.6-like [Monomorium pharaonis]